jgi:hypothetical protein
MHLVPVTKENIERHVDFRILISDEEQRNYYATIDMPNVILANGNEYGLLDDDGHIHAAIIVSRKPGNDDTIIVQISVEIDGKDPQKQIDCLHQVLLNEHGRLASHSTRYRIYNMPGNPYPKEKMEKWGFDEVVGSYRYERKAGPPREGEFPHADRAVAKGYQSILLDDAYIEKHPDIFETLADIYNRAFITRASVNMTTAERIEYTFRKETNGMIIAKLDDEVTGCIGLTHLGKSILSPQYCCLRRHWGTGSVDLMCRHLAEHVAKQWNLPIVGYAEATNAASWKALERFGLTRVEESLMWERMIPAGERFVI